MRRFRILPRGRTSRQSTALDQAIRQARHRGSRGERSVVHDGVDLPGAELSRDVHRRRALDPAKSRARERRAPVGGREDSGEAVDGQDARVVSLPSRHGLGLPVHFVRLPQAILAALSSLIFCGGQNGASLRANVGNAGMTLRVWCMSSARNGGQVSSRCRRLRGERCGRSSIGWAALGIAPESRRINAHGHPLVAGFSLHGLSDGQRSRHLPNIRHPQAPSGGLGLGFAAAPPMPLTPCFFAMFVEEEHNELQSS